MDNTLKKKKGRLHLIQQLLAKSTGFAKKSQSKENNRVSLPPSNEVLQIETKNAYLIVIHLAGADKDTIVVKRTSKNSIQVTCKHKKCTGGTLAEKGTEEYHNGMVYMTFDLTPNADKSNIEASFKNGLLTIRIPKLKKSKPDTFHLEVE